MRVVTPSGTTIELGDIESTPTIGITDYSARVTDAFGATTVVERGFSRTMSVKLGVPFDSVDDLQRQLAGLRATPALWVADDRYACLSVQGFYKDFSLDLQVPPLAYCTLTVEGLAETAAPADPGSDPAPEGTFSTLRLLHSIDITDSVLTASSVAEDDWAEWSVTRTFEEGARVISTVTHRIYESLLAGSIGNDPATAADKWLDIGPTNKWAMFDQALGTVTASPNPIVVTLTIPAGAAIALLEVTASTVRVQATGYDRTLAVSAGAILIEDLPPAGGSATFTITGSGSVSVGTLMVGALLSLGITESSPTAGITDFSVKTVDDFGAVTLVQRAWSKGMTAKALIRTDAIDAVVNRIAAVRARPSLWIGQDGLDSLTVYGFFKDFSVELDVSVSKLSLSIEGLSTAADIKPLGTLIAWPDISDPDGTKPADNATVGAPTGTIVHDRPAEQVAAELDLTNLNILAEQTKAGIWRAESDQQLNLPDGTSVRQAIAQTKIIVDEHTAYFTTLYSLDSNGNAKALFALNADGVAVGFAALAGPSGSEMDFMASRYRFVDDSGQNPITALAYADGVWTLPSIRVDTLKVNSAAIPVYASANGQLAGSGTSATTFQGYTQSFSETITLPVAGTIDAMASIRMSFAASPSVWQLELFIDGVSIDDAGGINSQEKVTLLGQLQRPAGTYTVTVKMGGATTSSMFSRKIKINGLPFTE